MNFLGFLIVKDFPSEVVARFCSQHDALQLRLCKTLEEEEMFGTVTNDEELVRAHKETQNLRQKVAVSETLDRVNTIPSIDITAGTYRSKALIVLLWATILITYFA